MILFNDLVVIANQKFQAARVTACTSALAPVQAAGVNP
jgi:hypothetical protein